MSNSNNYGTVPSGHTALPHGPPDSSEEGPLLGKPPSSQKRLALRLRKHMMVNVSRDWADLILLAGYIITGLLDSSSISIWGAFVSMQTVPMPSLLIHPAQAQTFLLSMPSSSYPGVLIAPSPSSSSMSSSTTSSPGNTIYLGLGLSNPSASTKWIKSLVSILSFCLGSLAFSAYHRRLSPKRRWVLTSAYLLQFLCIIAAALIVSLAPDAPTTDHSMHWQIAVPLAALAFQSSGQAVTSRVLSYGGLTSVVLTSNYCDLFGDPKLTAGMTQNVERNRRIAAPLLLLAGAVAGGFFANSEVGLQGALWTAAVLKAGIVVAWCFWKAEESVDG
ncbi:MAG: hypothetical protein Q9159_007621 [Coniocarpon cinnabarinum]